MNDKAGLKQMKLKEMIIVKQKAGLIDEKIKEKNERFLIQSYNLNIHYFSHVRASVLYLL